MAAEQCRSSRRRAGSAIQLNHMRLATGKKLVQDGKISDYDGDKAEPSSCLGDGNETRRPRMGHDVAITKRKERHTAHIELTAHRGRRLGARLQRPFEQPEGRD